MAAGCKDRRPRVPACKHGRTGGTLPEGTEEAGRNNPRQIAPENSLSRIRLPLRSPYACSRIAAKDATSTAAMVQLNARSCAGRVSSRRSCWPSMVQVEAEKHPISR